MAEFLGLDGNNQNENKGAGIEPMHEQEEQIVGDGNDEQNLIGYQGVGVHQAPANAPTPAGNITVHVTDQTAPIVLLFGAPSSGKTMTLVRLGKYLHNKGYKLIVDYNFCRNAWEYGVNANRFNEMLGTTKALKGTNRNDFLFIKIVNAQGGTVCQILEGAGEDYFPSHKINNINRANIPFPNYMATVFAGNNKKVWAFLVEPNWAVDYNDKQEYENRIEFCKRQHSGGNDKFIILYNKVDIMPFAINNQTVNKKYAMQACNNEYRGLFHIFKNPSPWPFSSKYVCEFMPFSTGTYGLVANEEELANYTPSNDAYPEALWNMILKCIKG